MIIYIINEILSKKRLDIKNFPIDLLYKVGIENVKNNIEFYFDKTYTCESVIKELFKRGIVRYIDDNSFSYLEK